MFQKVADFTFCSLKKLGVKVTEIKNTIESASNWMQKFQRNSVKSAFDHSKNVTK